MRLIQRVEEATMRHSDSRYSIGTVMLNHQDDIPTMTLKDVADLSYASKASVVRFAQSFGYPGWKEFHRDLVAQILEQKNHPERVDVDHPCFQTERTSDLYQTVVNPLQRRKLKTDSSHCPAKRYGRWYFPDR